MTPSLLSLPRSRRAALASTIGLVAFSVPDAYLASLSAPEHTSSLEDNVRETERRRLRSLLDADLDLADALHADDFQLIDPSGSVVSKADYLGELASGVVEYVLFEPASEIAVRLYPDAAALRYRSDIEMRFSDGSADAGQFWQTDLYERRNGQWRAVWSQGSRIG